MIAASDVAVVGCGFMGRNHAHAVSDHPTLNLRSVVDVDEDLLSATADDYDADRALTDYETALEDADAAIVATPESLHADQANAALDNGCHLLLEKPITEDTNKAWSLVDRGARTDLATGVSFILRYDPGYSRARDAVVAGDVGDVVSVRARRGITRAESRRIGGRGHPLYYMNVHDIDAMRWCIGSEVASVVGVERRGELSDVDVPDATQALFTFENGAVGVLEGYGTLPNDMPGGIDAALELVGTDGTVAVDTPGSTLNVYGERYDRPDTRHWPVVNGRMDGAVRRQIDRFARSIAGDAELLASLEDGARAQAVADATRAAIDRNDRAVVDYS